LINQAPYDTLENGRFIGTPSSYVLARRLQQKGGLRGHRVAQSLAGTYVLGMAPTSPATETENLLCRAIITITVLRSMKLRSRTFPVQYSGQPLGNEACCIRLAKPAGSLLERKYTSRPLLCDSCANHYFPKSYTDSAC
jgi:hypothetical protein